MTKGSITIVGLGPGNVGHLSMETLTTLQTAQQVILRTIVHPSVSELVKQGVQFESCDHFYETGSNFEEVYAQIVQTVVASAQTQQVVYAVPGSPLVAERTVVLLRAAAQEAKIKLTILPAMSFLDLTYVKLGLDPIAGLRIVDATDKLALADAGKYPLIITQVYSRLVASELKLNLMEVLDDDYEIYFMRNLGLADEDFMLLPLFELDRQEQIDHLTTVYIPPRTTGGVMDTRPLLDVMQTLREPGGCLWDREQTHASIRKGLIEEVYELLEAIDEKNVAGMREELGDVLLQVVFHARLAEEEGAFTMQDVIDDIVAKLIHRHPHVFGTIEVNDAAEILRNWEQLKLQEKTERKQVLDGISPGLPALMRAYKIQAKVAKVGFDWSETEAVWAKVQEELAELREAVAIKDLAEQEGELGDVLFAVTNYARHLGLEPETALNASNNRFVQRFAYVEAKVTQHGGKWQDFNLSKLDELWLEAKKNEKKENKKEIKQE
ncbi:MAG: nucleoside triphosphate pyrophosphohydrolase [Acidaminococcaceae bacterium]